MANSISGPGAVGLTFEDDPALNCDMLATMAAWVLLAPKFDFATDGPYDGSIPRPDAILGYRPGDRLTTYRDQERVVLAIAQAAKSKIKVIEFGKSTEGRPLRVLAISSASNIAKLDQIQKQHAEIAQGKGDPSKTVPILWINQTIHGNETASFETAMWTLYNLAAGKGSVAKALEKSVVMLNPVYNPDGHERYVVYYNSIATGSDDQAAFEGSEPATIYGRVNHYRFDMNRDRVAFSQDETRQEFAEMLKWGPQVYVDQHGQVDTYFFPPEPMSINPNVDRARNAKWTEYLGRATAKAFDERGLTYFTKDTFDLYYPGYLDSSATLSGAIGMTHETDAGRRLNQLRPDGTLLTHMQGVYKHYISARALVLATAAQGQDLLGDYAKFKREAVTGKSAGKFQRVVVAGDPRALKRLQTHLKYAGIESGLAAKAWTQGDAHDYWSDKTGKQDFPANSLVVDIAQSQGPLAKSLLEPGNGFEPEFVQAQLAKKKAVPEGEDYPGAEGTEFYDTTGWALPYAYNLKAWWCESAPKVAIQTVIPASATVIPGSTIGYYLRYRDDADAIAVFELLSQGVKARVTTKPIKVEGSDVLEAGTFLFLDERNEDGYAAKLQAAARKHDLQILPLKSAYPEADRYSPGSGYAIDLRAPKVAVVMGSGQDIADSGPLWYLFERVFKLPFTPVRANALNNTDLSRFTAIVFAPGTSGTSVTRLRDWISAGNVAVGIQNVGWALGSSNYVDLKSVGEAESLPGSLFRAKLDPRSFLSYGYGTSDIAVPFSGDSFYKRRTEGGSMVTLSGDEKVTKLLSGWAWPDDTEKKLRDAVFAQQVPVGRGHLVLFTQDISERAMWPGLNKLLLNAIVIGSGR